MWCKTIQASIDENGWGLAFGWLLVDNFGAPGAIAYSGLAVLAGGLAMPLFGHHHGSQPA